MIPSDSPKRYESLTLWRGVACLMIVIYHSLYAGYGPGLPDSGGVIHVLALILPRFWIGVPLFFVISGYCITASADALRARSAPGISFFWRRFRRIYPPYWVWFTVAAIAVYLVERLTKTSFFGQVLIINPAEMTIGQWFGNLTLTEMWRWHFTGGIKKLFLSPIWTLCYEEQFYAVIGLVLLLPRRFFFVALNLITLGVVAGFFLLPISLDGFFFDGQWLMFAAGVLAYYVVNLASPGRKIWFCAPFLIGILGTLTSPKQLLIDMLNEPNQSYFAAFVFALLIIGLHPWDDLLTRSRWSHPLRYCGEMCYSLYLVHWPTVTIIAWALKHLGLQGQMMILGVILPACLVISLVLARLFHVAIERRFWNSRGRPLSPRAT